MSIASLIRLIGESLDNPKLSDLRTILMVGGFSECELVQDAIRDKIGTSIKLIIPEEVEEAVLKGAVLIGQITKSFRRNPKLFAPIIDTHFVTACLNRIFKFFVLFNH
jgi:activator of 2-hydroxyglutaryl-CoA dehydratase